MPELVLDGGHRYWRDGVRVPGVTEILDGLGLIDTRWFTEESRRRGAAVHAAIHFYLERDLHWPSVDERIRGYVEAAIAFLEDSKFEAVEVEKRVLHEGVPTFAGTLDVAGKFGGVETVADWKSGAFSAVTGMQIAAYDIALGGPKRRRRIGVQIRDNGKYRKTDFDDRRDYQRFMSAADLYTHFIFNTKQKAEEHDAAAVA
jgi:hypothetical protein